jgi:hypothetical protein
MFRKLTDPLEMSVSINELHGVTRQNTLSSRSMRREPKPLCLNVWQKPKFTFQILCSVKGEFEV